MSTFDVISIGSAAQDIFLESEAFRAVRDVRTNDEVEQFPLGAKIEMDAIHFSTGGGATNAAVTFARQGFKSAFMGKLGHDPAGKAVLNDLHEDGVDSSLVAYHPDIATDYSTLLVTPKGERVILIYRGSSHTMQESDFDLEHLQAKWLYITSLAGNMNFLKQVLTHAKENGIKTAIDPGSKELEQLSQMQELLPLITMIKGNKEEMGKLVESDDPAEIARRLCNNTKYAIVTDGPNGSWATDGQAMYKAGMYEDVPVKDRTGAGDAFGSGFVAALLHGWGLDKAIVLGSANSTSVVQHIGAKKGIVSKSVKLHDMDLEKL